MGGASAKLTIGLQAPYGGHDGVGFQGAGKTTNGAKLAGLMKRQNGQAAPAGRL